MKIGKLIKSVIKFAPVIIPIAKKVLDSKKSTRTTYSKK